MTDTKISQALAGIVIAATPAVVAALVFAAFVK